MAMVQLRNQAFMQKFLERLLITLAPYQMEIMVTHQNKMENTPTNFHQRENLRLPMDETILILQPCII